MAVILDDFFPPYGGHRVFLARHVAIPAWRAGGRGSVDGAGQGAWPMVTSMALCSIVAVLFYLYASRRAIAQPDVLLVRGEVAGHLSAPCQFAVQPAMKNFVAKHVYAN